MDGEKPRKIVDEWHEDDLDLNEDMLKDNASKIKAVRILNLMAFWDTAGKKLAGNRIQDDTPTYTKVATGTSVTTISITNDTDDEVWEVYEVIAALQADGNAANRSLTVLGTTQALITLAIKAFETSAVVASLNQLVGITMTEGHSPNHFTVDAGVVAVVTDENSLPVSLGPGGLISATYTNKEAADLSELLIRYRKPNVTDET